MKCPSCPETVLSMSSRNGIEIDFCPTCRGVWLDRGELDKILDKSMSENSSLAHPNSTHPNSVQVSMDTYKRDFYKYKRKKSFLEELFD